MFSNVDRVEDFFRDECSRNSRYHAITQLEDGSIIVWTDGASVKLSPTEWRELVARHASRVKAALVHWTRMGSRLQIRFEVRDPSYVSQSNVARFEVFGVDDSLEECVFLLRGYHLVVKSDVTCIHASYFDYPHPLHIITCERRAEDDDVDRDDPLLFVFILENSAVPTMPIGAVRPSLIEDTNRRVRAMAAEGERFFWEHDGLWAFLSVCLLPNTPEDVLRHACRFVW